MPVAERIGRRNCIPVIYCKGTHYEVGFDVGRTFSRLIHSLLAASKPLNEVYLPLYETPEGKDIYNKTLACVKENFPQYVREIEGTADGACVPFHKLFLLHMDDILPNALNKKGSDSTNGCTTVCCNYPGQEILGHTEDAFSEYLNHIYFVSAHIIESSPQGRWSVREERFTSLCYAGHLPGFTMSYNHHGMIFSVNILSAKTLVAGKTPRFFLTRALLSAENMVQAQQILHDTDCGAAEGVSVNMTFLNQDGDRLFHNAEVGPALSTKESPLNILTASPGEHLFHCNKYLRLKIPEVGGMISQSSDERLRTMNQLPFKCKQDVINMLGDQSGKDFTVFRESGDEDFVKTIAVGIFDCVARTWSLYTDNPKSNPPIVVLPLILKERNKATA
uniref:Peptidase C45 hydrolase domain-containing protein n=2 Tax=Clastoptera arizonana TaxID=38151 RepID=A0A1B6DIH8_9HEMI